MIIDSGMEGGMQEAYDELEQVAISSSRRPRKRGWRSRPSRVHSLKPIWATSRGSTQVAPRSRTSSANGDVLAPQRLEPRGEVAQRRAREPGADLARVAQPPVLVVAEQQRAEVGAAALRRRVAADHELLLGRALELEPVARAAVDVRRVGALGDQPLPALAARLAEQLLAVAVAMRREADVAVELERPPQQRLAGAERERGRVVAGEVEQVEDVEEHRHRALAALLEALEAGLRAGEGDDLAVEHEAGRRRRARAPRRSPGSARSGSGGCATAAALARSALIATQRIPSSLRSKTQSGSENRSSVSTAFIGSTRSGSGAGLSRARSSSGRAANGSLTGRRSYGR